MGYDDTMHSKLALVATWLVAANAGADAKSAPPTPAVRAKITAEHPGRPPLTRLELDVILNNDAGDPRWFILPLTTQPRSGGVDTAQAFALNGRGKVTLGRFGGTGGFQAVLLPAHGEVTIHQLAFQNWGERGKKLAIEIIVAKGFKIGDHPDKKWFTGDPTSDAKADVGEAKSKPVGIGVTTPFSKELPVTFTADRRVTVEVAPLAN